MIGVAQRSIKRRGPISMKLFNRRLHALLPALHLPRCIYKLGGCLRLTVALKRLKMD